jgi:hypothetical protein
MADLFDRFVGAAGPLAAHTADSGDAWSDPASIDALSGGSLYTSGSFVEGTMPTSSWTPPGTDYSVEMVVGADAIPGATVGCCVRTVGSSGSQSYYFFQLNISAGVGVFNAYLYVNGSGYTQIGSNVTGISVATGDTFSCSVSGTGSSVTLTAGHNGTQIFSGTDSSSGRLTSAGAVGLRVVGGSSGNPDVLRTLWAGATSGPSQGITPSSASVLYGANQAFSATGLLPNESITWGATNGTVNPSSGASTTYSAPGTGSTDSISWTSADLPLHSVTQSIPLLTPPRSGLIIRPMPNPTFFVQ